MRITRDNLDRLIDARAIQRLMNNGRWWTVRRDGRTQYWKRNPDRFRLPIKFGMYSYGAIDELDIYRGELSNNYRVDPRFEIATQAAELLAA
jgi:hypothetical protein